MYKYYNISIQYNKKKAECSSFAEYQFYHPPVTLDGIRSIITIIVVAVYIIFSFNCSGDFIEQFIESFYRGPQVIVYTLVLIVYCINMCMRVYAR